MPDKQDHFAELELKQQRLLQQLAASPVVNLVGIVDAGAPGGSRLTGSEQWNMFFTFAAWRFEGGDVNSAKLRLQRQVTYEELSWHMDRIQPNMVLRVRAKLAEEIDAGDPQGLLVEIVSFEESDVELGEWVIRLQEPVTFDDSIFGTFALDRRMNWYTAATTWKGLAVALHLFGDEPAGIQEALKIAYTLWRSQDRWDTRLQRYAVQALLPLKNDAWLDEDEAKITTDHFRNRIALEDVTVWSDGSFEFWYNDGGLFLGHSIKIGGTISGGPTDADIAG